MPKKDYSQYTDYENYTMLTDRELEVLKMKNSGSSNGEIAEIIGVKYNTVSIYLTQATQKIDGIYDHEKMRERKKVYARRRQEDPEYRNKRKEYDREYYRKNRDKIKNSQKEYYRKKREEVNESQRNAFRFSKANITAESILAEHGKGKAIRQIADERGCSRANIYQISIYLLRKDAVNGYASANAAIPPLCIGAILFPGRLHHADAPERA